MTRFRVSTGAQSIETMLLSDACLVFTKRIEDLERQGYQFHHVETSFIRSHMTVVMERKGGDWRSVKFELVSQKKGVAADEADETRRS